jgi:malate dehydrogenase (oxaloacetate-decarboxylating)
MAIRCAHSIAEFAEKRGISPDSIMPNMEDDGLFESQAADVADQAAKEGLARSAITPAEVYARTKSDIAASRKMWKDMSESGALTAPPQSMLREALGWALDLVR